MWWPSQRLNSSSFLNRSLSASLATLRRVCVDELGVPVQVAPDLFLQADLQSRSFRLFRWCFQQRQVLFLLSSFEMHYSLQYKCLFLLLYAGKTRWKRSLRLIHWAGATLRFFWAAKGSRKWGSINGGCQEKTLPLPQGEGSFSDIELPSNVAR